MGEMRNAHKIVGILKVRDLLEDIDLDEMIILKWILG
jgi:hypothetical protein